MTNVWVYSVGPDLGWPSPSPDATGSPPTIDDIASDLQRIIGLTKYPVRVWRPFASEHLYRGPRQLIVLLVGDWRKFSRRDYFVAANALALDESGAARLFPAMVDRVEPGTGDDTWLERYRLLWNRLEKIAVMKLNPGVPSEWSGALASQVMHQILDSPEEIEKPAGRPARVFFSYSHRDEALRDELARHLKLLERTGLIEGWHDRQIRPGEEWAAQLDAHLFTADLILLLLSSDFFASDYCSEIEVPVALERHNGNAARAIPVVLRPVVWKHSPLARLQSLPTDLRPVTSWESLDSAFVNVSEGILGSVLAWKGQSPVKETGPEQRVIELRRRAIEAGRKRVVDAAMPAEVEIDRSAILAVLVRKPSSAGLRGLIAADDSYGLEPSDVHSKPVSLQFPIGQTNKPESIGLTVLVKAPDFDPPEQKRQFTLKPDGDSQPLIFLLAARRSGALKVVVEVYCKDALVTSCPLSTLAGSTEALKPASPNIASASFEVESGFDFAAALDLLDPDLRFGSAPDATELNQAEPTAVARAVAKSRGLLEQSKFSEAIQVIETGLSEFPDSPQLRAMLAYARAATASSERERVKQVMQHEALRLLREGLFVEALSVLDSAASRFPDAAEFRRLRDDVALRMAERRRSEEAARRAPIERERRSADATQACRYQPPTRPAPQAAPPAMPAPPPSAEPAPRPSSLPLLLVGAGVACVIALVILLLLR